MDLFVTGSDDSTIQIWSSNSDLNIEYVKNDIEMEMEKTEDIGVLLPELMPLDPLAGEELPSSECNSNSNQGGDRNGEIEEEEMALE